MASMSRRGFTHLGLDVSKNTMAVGILRPGEDVPDVEVIAHDGGSVRRLVARVGGPSGLWACYEAGPRRAMSCIACSCRWGCAAR
ncbi:MAG: hypothetical protein ACRDH5_09335 [bacterium]